MEMYEMSMAPKDAYMLLTQRVRAQAFREFCRDTHMHGSAECCVLAPPWGSPSVLVLVLSPSIF